MELQVDINYRSNELCEILLTGSLDTDTASQLEEKLETVFDSASKELLFNMKKLDYVSSAGIRVIAMACRKMKEKGGEILTISMQPQIQKVFEIVKALPNLKMFKSWEEMDEYLDAMQELEKSKT
ncbi:MAG: STAS domain-containing protein [Gammaproteobacteria bacterium]